MSGAESRYSRVSRRMWRDEKFRALSAPKPCARYLWLFLLTGTHCTAIPGLFSIGEAALAEELGWPVSATRSALEEIERTGMAKVDRGARLVWLPNALAHNPPASPNVVVGWRVPWSELPTCDLLTEARESFRRVLAEMGSEFARSFAIALGEEKPRPSPNPSGGPRPKALVKALAKGDPKPSPSQDQDQEQEQEEPERAEVGAAPLLPAQPKAKSPKPPEPEEPAPIDPKARAVYDAIVGDALLGSRVRRPADFAVRVTGPDAFPGVNVLGQVVRALAWNAGQRLPKRDGRAFLLGWLGRADKEAPEPSPLASGVYSVPMPPRHSREAPPAAIPPPPVVRKGDLAVDAPVMPAAQARPYVANLMAQFRAGVPITPDGATGNG